ncbi:MAG: Vitamin B12 dependent methionine synthase activation subunit [Tyzzerella sp.]|nr:Vitamin B12 dependent methionine synthase activation subunit [Tyzzerella sp.]
MDIRTREAVRYLGYGRHAIDERTLTLIQDSFQELDQVSDARFVYRIFEISKADENGLTIGNLEIKSKNLAKNLKNCQEAVLFGATLGTRVDMLMKKYSVTDMSKTVVLQACAAAELEEYCDEMQKQIAIRLGEGLYLRPRFSPGYGDFSILHQKDVLQMLEAQKKIGLTLTEGYMLTPTKSVTAVIGISREKQLCHIKGCEECEKVDCAYRRS